MSIMPVRYVDNRDKCKDILSYSFEEEWRLIYERAKKDADGEKIGDSIPFIKPAVIICGDSLNRKSSEYQRLVEIATEKNIAVLQ